MLSAAMKLLSPRSFLSRDSWGRWPKNVFWTSGLFFFYMPSVFCIFERCPQFTALCQKPLSFDHLGKKQNIARFPVLSFSGTYSWDIHYPYFRDFLVLAETVRALSLFRSITVDIMGCMPCPHIWPLTCDVICIRLPGHACLVP